ncbi:LLM class F420-dependent oxidoreductase [Nonomuraea rhizosphaerae]|uniref:LLM class F420-dependent oxidoreductase n=1 Tax=Nonomuraea rhizosphaerae TaxID=2665663 RepID=UPI001C5E65F8|nr:LLM class F420-dependent oxidoreductase [Nonomuraea rhizosphaerae]
MDTGHVGVWHPLINKVPAETARQAARRMEELGYGSLWMPESASTKDPFAMAAVLLAETSRIALGTGIANLWARDAISMAASGVTLSDAYPDRFLLGIGVSHGPVVGRRGHDYTKPLTATRAYLEKMDSVAGDFPYTKPPRLLAALRPKMLELSRDQADGAHPYFVPPEHTVQARAILGPDRLLIPEQAVVVESDPATARATARTHMSLYLRLPNYVNNLRTLGFTDEDFADGGSDRLADAIVAWGSPETVAKRVRAHLDAGADHVALQPLSAGGPDLADALTQLESLTTALGL